MQNRPWQSPDNYTSGGQFEDDYQPHHENGHPRGSLGQFIERSTSAPPPSSTFFGTSSNDKFGGNRDSLVGKDLLDFVYGDMSLKGTSGGQSNGLRKSVSNSDNGESEDEFGAVWYDSGDRHENRGSGMLSNSLGSMGLSVSRPLSASGDTFRSGSDNRRGLLNNDLTMSSLGAGLVRSQSAAPSTGRTSLGPPPGLSEFANDSYSTSSSSSRQQQQISQWGQGIRRPASAGVLGGGGSIGGGGTTLSRPAAKSLMDFIQEDSPPEDYRIGNDMSKLSDQNNNVRNQVTVISSAGMDFPGRRSTSPAYAPHRPGLSVINQNQLSSPNGMGAYVSAPSPAQYQHQYHAHQQEQLLDDGLQRGYEQHQTRQLPRMEQNDMNAQPIMPNNIYSQVQHQQLHQPQQPQQHIYYNGQRIDLPHGIQSQSLQTQGLQPPHGMHPQGMQGLPVQGIQSTTQAIQLPNGQTVYVNTSPPPQQTYGYTAVQYGPPQHGHIIQQQVHPNEGGQYVTVVPVQGGPQLTYWQPNGVAVPQTAVGIANAAGVASPVTISQLHSPGDTTGSMQQQQQNHSNTYGNASGSGSRGREKGGGRGRRGCGNIGGRRGSDAKPSSAPLSSALLEEFRASKSRDWTMRRIEGHVVEFCQDQNGSRFIQQRLEMGDVSEQQIVIHEVLPAIRRLRNDVFGNYVVQKLLDFGTPKIKAEMQATLEGEMVPLSLQMYGCRVVQKALEALNEDDLPRLLQEFHHNVLNCIHDQNGNHVIQKCIEVLNSKANKASQASDIHRAVFLAEQIDFIVDDVLLNSTTLSCHPYGCRVLQRILEHCANGKKLKILDEIKRCHEKLLDDQYGNYVIQHVLQFGRDEDRDSILDIVVKNGLLGLSRQKFASNVVEKLLKYGNANHRCAVVREMLKKADDPSMPSEPADGSATVVLLMVRDAYANYVVQTTLDVVPESVEKQKLLEELNSHSEELRNYTFAKHIVAKLSSLNGGS